ncbi:LTA synthase family protein [Brucella anthropi]|uniref:LTA synthase family protein n=1 Tax=Brucella anthropi TaxID=529 RepID=UPI00235EF120|nr:alkaline phosphatase family protein [Brucella anthropi]
MHVLIFLYTISIVLYVALRMIFPRVLTILVVVFVYCNLFYISFKKYHITWEPLLAYDFIGGLSYRTMLDFASKAQIGASLFVLLMLLTYLFYAFRTFGIRCFSFRLFGFFIVTWTVVVGGASLKSEAGSYVERHGIVYDSWDYARNIQRNGLIIHLVQTYLRQFPSQPSATERSKFAAIVPREISPSSVQQFILVQCESCWYDSNHFRTSFESLISVAAAEFRSVSPVFGGGTANAEFEILTGLPLKNAPINGIVYREYRKEISSNAITLASVLKNSGYGTYAIHNSLRYNWSRDEVLPKLGFGRFISFEDMHGKLTFKNWLARDELVYSEARSVLQQTQNKPVFIHALTVYTHGPFEVVNRDNGFGDYTDRIQQAMADALAFIKILQENNPNAVAVLYGDHKPYFPDMSSGVHR